jgi:hypothetical protein
VVCAIFAVLNIPSADVCAFFAVFYIPSDVVRVDPRDVCAFTARLCVSVDDV